MSLPRGAVFFCDFGCAIWAPLDCRRPQGQMWWWGQDDRHKLRLTLPEWFAAWLAGQPHHVWARKELWLESESWTRDRDEDREERRQDPVVLDPGQMPLW